MKTITIEAVREDYAGLAESYETRWQGFNDAVRVWVMERFPEIESGAVLDLGCGTGAMLRLIHEKHPALRLTGVDASPAMLALARQAVPAAKVIESDAGVWHGAMDKSFDVVLSLNVLHHLNDPAKHLQYTRKQCRQGGRVFLCDFANNTIRFKITRLWWRLFHPSYHKAFGSRELRRMVEAAGFKIKDSAILKPDAFWCLQIYELTP